ncbi:MAG: hypothetical protein LC634_01050 [Sphingomonadales bacterium]|nr:hypothetical protein [Sphingomonadales bacterium]
MRIAITGLGACLPLAGLLAGCGMGEPASAEHVENLMRADSVEDGYEVSWVHAEPLEEEGSFRTFVDRAKPAEAGSDETWMCNVNATTVSNSWSCQTVSPAIIAQAVALLEQQYTGRGLEVADYEIARSGEGTGFTGNMVLRDPVSGDRAWVPCAGTQDGTRFEIECDQDGARMLPPEGSPGEPPAKG